MKPTIGIRPIIDGRWGGIREGLEEQTRKMAQNAKKLIESNLFYTDGTPVQVVVFDGTIGGGAEAARCKEFFDTQNVVGTLSVTPCWCYGSETIDLDPYTVKAVWGLNATALSTDSTEYMNFLLIVLIDYRRFFGLSGRIWPSMMAACL